MSSVLPWRRNRLSADGRPRCAADAFAAAPNPHDRHARVHSVFEDTLLGMQNMETKQRIDAPSRYGWESRRWYSDKRFAEVEADLERDWERAQGESRLTWTQANAASRDASDPVDRRNY